MSHVRSFVLAAVVASLAAGCVADDGPKYKPPETRLSKEQMLSTAAQMKGEGERVRDEGLAKKRQGGAAEGDKLIAQGEKLITDAKLMKDQALLSDSKIVE